MSARVARMSRDRVLSVRLTDDEHQALTQLADALGMPISELARRAALALTYPAPAVVGGTSAAPLVRMLVGGPHDPDQ